MNANLPDMLRAAHAAQASAEGSEPALLGFATAPWIVALSMICVLVIIWKAGGFRALISGLDSKIATIRKQLDEAKALRAEAEALLADAKAKQAAAHQDAAGILAHAKVEADQLVAQAKIDAETLIERRGKMAEDKIAAAERSAIAEVRAKAAAASAAAAAKIIAERHDTVSDKALIERTIASLN
jgi:F-type H+-transporting ATPase subunit b